MSAKKPAPPQTPSPLAHLGEALRDLEQRNLLRGRQPEFSAPGPHVLMDGREIIMLASNNYLGLADHPSVKQCAAQAVARYGTGTGGSRLTTGSLAPHHALEQALAAFKNRQAALVFNTGYMANVGVITALCGKGDVIFSDSLNHASIIDGCRQSRAEVIVYAHNDAAHLSQCIEQRKAQGGWRHGLVVTDAVFSMAGDIADLPALARVAHAHGLALMVDEAHATGVIGATGHGIEQHFGLGQADAGLRADIITGTLSKALGSEGGFVCGDTQLIDWLRTTARPYIFSTALPAASIAAAHAALDILVAEPERVARLHHNTALFCRLLQEAGLAVHSPTAIVPVPVGDERKAVVAGQRLREAGCLASAIRHPSVPLGQAILRTSLCSEHAEDDLATAAALIAKVLA